MKPITDQQAREGPVRRCRHFLTSLARGVNDSHAYGDSVIAGETERILFALAQAVEQRDQRTARHCERLAHGAAMLGVALGLDRGSLLALYCGGYLHDVGKVGIPDSILLKAGPLTLEEWTVMRTHPLRGEEICRHLRSLGPVLPIIRHHHERWDGSGYPDGMSGEQIPLLARVLQVVDVYEALTSQRPYKAAYPPVKALQILRSEVERGWRDPEITDLFIKIHAEIEAGVARDPAGAETSLDGMRRSLAKLQAIIGTDTAAEGAWPTREPW